MKKKLFLFSICIIMLFIADAQNVGIGTTAPLARLHVTDSAVLFSAPGIPATGPYPNLPIQGPGRRMLWYPAKAAFRVGYAGTEWDKDSIGLYSFASGFRNLAKGAASASFGEGSKAIGPASFVVGSNSTATGYASLATGIQTKATGDYSIAIGYFSEASGITSTAMGYEARATNNDAFAINQTTLASGVASFAAGTGNKAKAVNGAVIGRYNDSLDNPDGIVPANADRIFQIGNGTADNARSNALTVLRNGNIGIGITDPGYRLDISNRMRLRSGGDLNNSAGIFLNNTNNSGIPAFIGMQSNENIGFYGSTSGWSFVMNTTTGRTGIGTTNPASTLEVNGFTKMGSDAPAVKVKKLTGTTSAVEGFNVNIPHGITASKILSVSVLIESSTNNFTPPGFTHFAGYEYNYDILDGAVWIFNVDGNSGNILSKPFKVLITYEE